MFPCDISSPKFPYPTTPSPISLRSCGLRVVTSSAMLAASCSGDIMLTLYSYPTLFGVADNNGYGLKVFAFLKLAGLPFRHEHIFDASEAPRGQLPYIVDGHNSVGDSETILAYVTEKYRVTLDVTLDVAQRTTNLLITRTLDDLYWVM